MKILITGSAGFIGSHLAEALVTSGHEIVGIDSFLPNYAREVKEANISGLLDNDRFTFMERTLIDPSWLGEIDFDIVVHLAALPGVRQSWGTSFSDYVENNVLATQRLLEVLKNRTGVRLVHVSSSSVYGDRDESPLTEDLPPEPISPYAITKESAERLVKLYSKQYGLSSVILRLFTVYGPRQRPDMAIYRFIKAVSKGGEVEIYGSGSMHRDFTFVVDVVRGILSAVERDIRDEIINIGSGRAESVERVVYMIGEMLGKEVKVRRVGMMPGDVKGTLASIDKARGLLDYQPGVEIREGIEKQIIWMREAAII